MESRSICFSAEHIVYGICDVHLGQGSSYGVSGLGQPPLLHSKDSVQAMEPPFLLHDGVDS